MKQIVIGSDHAGYKMKQFLIQQLQDAGYDVEDKGTYSEDSVDAGAYAIKVCEDVANNLDTKYGILICGTGIGMSMMANKVKGIRASLVSDLFSAEMTRAHNDANVLCMGARIISEYMAWEFTKVWLSTEHLGGKYTEPRVIVEVARELKRRSDLLPQSDELTQYTILEYYNNMLHAVDSSRGIKQRLQYIRILLREIETLGFKTEFKKYLGRRKMLIRFSTPVSVLLMCLLRNLILKFR